MSHLLHPCGCPAELPCGCGAGVMGQAALREMRQAQEATMAHVAAFLRYEPERDTCSGQLENGEYPELRVCCGLKPADWKPQALGNSDGGAAGMYTLRLPRWMADRVRPLSRFVVDQAHGRPLARPLTLEQVGEASVGPTAVVVRARAV